MQYHDTIKVVHKKRANEYMRDVLEYVQHWQIVIGIMPNHARTFVAKVWILFSEQRPWCLQHDLFGRRSAPIQVAELLNESLLLSFHLLQRVQLEGEPAPRGGQQTQNQPF